MAIWGRRGREGGAEAGWAGTGTFGDRPRWHGGRPDSLLSPCICIRQPWGAGDLARLQEGTIWKVRGGYFYFLQDVPETNEGKEEARQANPEMGLIHGE